ncbi:SoxR reducing system RseC family protein [Natronospora cellulosivora (SeqCode)]
MEEIGEILNKKGNQALVKIKRHSLCSKCTNKCQLAQPESHEVDEIEIEVDNPIGAKIGQFVKIEMKDQPVVIASIIIYIIPLIFMIAGYFMGIYIIELLGYQGTEIVGIISSLLFLACSFLFIRIIDKILSRKKEYHPKIKEIVETPSE